MTVAIQGIAGSFHHEAAIQYFKEEDFKLIECKNFKDLAVEISKSSDFGLMAIENSIAGAIIPNYSLISKYGLKIVGEIYLPIQHMLLALPGTKIEDITQVQSHPMALLQSENFLDDFPHWNKVEKFDTASCAKEIRDKELKTVSAIGTETAADLFNLNILKHNIQNNSDNYTRFFVLSKNMEVPEDYNKASICFKTEHKSGSLVNLLSKMAKLDLNLTKIQSIPIPNKPFEYSFYADVVFDNQSNYNRMKEILQRTSSDLEILGEYKEDKFF